jgi:ATP-dependent Lhr-like helicase
MEWWTFGGAGANATLAHEFSQATESQATYDSFTLSFESHVAGNAIEHALQDLRGRNAEEMRPAVEERAVEGLKFSACLPTEMAVRTLRTRLRDGCALRVVLEERVSRQQASGKDGSRFP